MSCSLIEHIDELPDPRVRGRTDYPLIEIVFLCISAIISGFDGWEAIEDFGHGKLDWLRKCLPYENGIPRHDTVARVMSCLSPKALQSCFVSWVQSIAKITEGEIVAIDGKQARRSYDKKSRKSAIHMVSAWACQNGVVLGQQKTDAKSNEITAIPQLLDILELRRESLKENPAVLLQGRDIGGIEKPRDRYLTTDEIKTLLLFLDSDNSRMSLQTKLAIKIILHTGIRSGELRLATWSEIDYQNSLWTIPKEHTKQDETMRIHLTEPVKIMFRELQYGSKSDFILSSKEDVPLSPKALSRAISRIQERVGIPHWTAHDLRRSFCTQIGETLHIDPVVIEKCLGHKMPKIMATYNRNEMLVQRKEALTKWSHYLESLLQDNVVPMQARKTS